MTRHRNLVAMLGVVALTAALSACGDDDGGDVRTLGGACAGSGTAAASGSEAGTPSDACPESGPAPGPLACEPVGDAQGASATVDVTLTEYEITLDPTDTPAGKIHFRIHNAGALAHEVVVIQGMKDVPTDEEGALDEEALPEGAFIGEVEAFPGGEDCEGTFSLPAGSYLVLCNTVDLEAGAHYGQGMVTELNVA